MKRTFLATTLALAALISIPTYAQDNNPQTTEQQQQKERKGKKLQGKQRKHFNGNPLLNGLELTDTQKAEIKKISENSKTEIKKVRESVAEQIKNIRQNQEQQIQNILTPEQKAKYEANKEKMKNDKSRKFKKNRKGKKDRMHGQRNRKPHPRMERTVEKPKSK